jgi:hypothetical protein
MACACAGLLMDARVSGAGLLRGGAGKNAAADQSCLNTSSLSPTKSALIGGCPNCWSVVELFLVLSQALGCSQSDHLRS